MGRRSDETVLVAVISTMCPVAALTGVASAQGEKPQGAHVSVVENDG
jgi:hypothetical protein